MKKILAINTANSGGGAENVAYTLCREMHRRGYVSRLMVGRIDYGAEALAQRLVIPVPGNRLLYSAGDFLDELLSTQYLWYLSSFTIPGMREFSDADVVHLHNLHGNYFNPRNPNADQAHHFAAFFRIGISAGSFSGAASDFASYFVSNPPDLPLTNPGDYLLGGISAWLGASYAANPRYNGNEIKTEVVNGPQATGGIMWNKAINNADLYYLAQ